MIARIELELQPQRISGIMCGSLKVDDGVEASARPYPIIDLLPHQPAFVGVKGKALSRHDRRRCELDAMLTGARCQSSRLFDVLPAAWGMDDATFEDLAGLSRSWLAQWRRSDRSRTSDELAIIRCLMSFHQVIGRLMYTQPGYPKWWRRR